MGPIKPENRKGPESVVVATGKRFCRKGRGPAFCGAKRTLGRLLIENFVEGRDRPGRGSSGGEGQSRQGESNAFHGWILAGGRRSSHTLGSHLRGDGGKRCRVTGQGRARSWQIGGEEKSRGPMGAERETVRDAISQSFL